MAKLSASKVVLVGCGPGDPELLTIKGLNAIKKADIVFYDALVNTSLLNNVRDGVECVYVGKRFNKHKFSQEAINQMLIDATSAYANVVRLKGGDSYVFGRGAEEVEYLEDFGVEVEVIPGISSALSVPASQGIPLTKRFINESFWVLTGTTSEGAVTNDLKFGAQSTATLVILMGLRKFELIMNEVLLYRSEFTPFAIIQNGTLPNEKIIINTLNNYKEVITDIDYKDPGVIIIGDVVSQHPSFFEEEIRRVLEFTV